MHFLGDCVWEIHSCWQQYRWLNVEEILELEEVRWSEGGVWKI